MAERARLPVSLRIPDQPRRAGGADVTISVTFTVTADSDSPTVTCGRAGPIDRDRGKREFKPDSECTDPSRLTGHSDAKHDDSDLLSAPTQANLNLHRDRQVEQSEPLPDDRHPSHNSIHPSPHH